MDVSAALLGALLKALEMPEHHRSAGSGARLLARTATEGYLPEWRLEDYLLDTDPRLARPYSGLDIMELAKAANLHQRNITHRPRATSNSVTFSASWTAEDAAGLLILLECLGFHVDPSPLVDALLPKLPSRGMITEAQLDVLWYARTRGRRSVQLDVVPKAPRRSIKEFTTSHGYKVEGWLSADGDPVQVAVRGPKYRKLKAPVETVCKHCGFVWYRGDPDSSAAHRREHKERMIFLDPAPDPRMVEAMRTEAEPERVTWLSPKWKQDALDDRARLFRLETHYSFVGWGAAYENDQKAQGFLMTRADGAIVGCAVFRWRHYSDAPSAWALQWVWVCPAARRTGVLRARWSAFRSEFGDFVIERPISEGMRGFLDSVEPGHHSGEPEDVESLF